MKKSLKDLQRFQTVSPLEISVMEKIDERRRIERRNYVCAMCMLLWPIM